MLSAPGGAIATGQSALVSLSGLPRREVIVSAPVALHVNLAPPTEPGPFATPATPGPVPRPAPGSHRSPLPTRRQVRVNSGAAEALAAARPVKTPIRAC